MNLENLKPIPVTLSGGTVLNYVRAGSGLSLIFIHGAMGDYRAWNPQWEYFTKQFDCISYSRRYSFPNPNPMNTRRHNALVDAEDLEGLMDELSIRQAILVGSSYGGFTALAMAVRAPARVHAMVSVEAPMMRYAYRSETGAKIADDFKNTTAAPARKAFEQGKDIEGITTLTAGIIGKKPTDIPAPVLERRKQNMNAARSLALSDDEFPLLDPTALAQLSMPILLMSGENTAPVHRAIFSEVCKTLPQASSRIVQGSGHSVSQQQPEIFNKTVLGFLSNTLDKTA